MWSVGFRPFYLCASVFAALSIALWSLEFAGWLPGHYMQAPFRHAHEMLFGYTLAVIAGFLLTAVRNWTGQPTASGPALAALVALWVAGRVLILTPFALASLAVNAAFPLALALAIAIPLARAGNRRNYFFVALLVGVSVLEVTLHAAARDWIDWPVHASLQVGLDLVLFVIAVIAGRVVPMFTNNAIPGAGALRHPLVEKLALGGVLALVAADALGLEGAPLAVLALLVALAHAVRWLGWRPWRTAKTPLVWILHLSYAWIPVHLVLRALAVAGAVATPWATHSLTLGVIGGMTIGMMTRTARGHTGAALVAGRAEIAMYSLVHAAALVRVFGPLFAPRDYTATIVFSALLWSSAFALYAIRYAPLLARARVAGD